MKKSLINTIIAMLYFTVIVCFAIQPARYSKAFVDGITVWAHNVLPVIFPFALLTTLFTRNCKFGKFSITKALFNIRCDSLFLTSFLCGYPVGARAISEQNIDEETATILCSFCSTPSPIFLIATVGIAIGNTTATLIICVSQLVAMLLNGLLYTRRQSIAFATQQQSWDSKEFATTLTNSILAVLAVGALIALFFMLTEIARSLLPQSIANHPALFFAIGLLEMTSGILKICSSCDILCATVCSSALLAFGGLCISLQCFAFVSQKGVKFSNLIKMKCTQCAFATIFAFVLGVIFL